MSEMLVSRWDFISCHHQCGMDCHSKQTMGVCPVPGAVSNLCEYEWLRSLSARMLYALGNGTYRVAICTRDHLLACGNAAMLASGVSLQDLLPKPQASSAAQARTTDDLG